jgi:ABC-type polysaccharide/polyol phosphate export permease
MPSFNPGPGTRWTSMAYPITGFDNVSNSMSIPFVSFVLSVVSLFRSFIISHPEVRFQDIGNRLNSGHR